MQWSVDRPCTGSLHTPLAWCPHRDSCVFLSVAFTQPVLDMSSVSAGGLTENDFIVAAHINNLDLTELLTKRKARFWA